MAWEDALEQQVESGKHFVRARLAAIARELDDQSLNNLDFEVTDADFDFDRVSLVDRKHFRVVMKIELDDITDCPADPAVRRRLEAELREAIESYRSRSAML